MGAFAFGLLMLAELALSVLVFDRSVAAYLAPVNGTRTIGIPGKLSLRSYRWGYCTSGVGHHLIM
jgi:hypothetical protein